MQPLPVPETVKIYMLVCQNGMMFTLSGAATGNNFLGTGFYYTRQEAEQQRTIEYLKYKDTGSTPRFHVFELEIPNPAYEKNT